MTLATVLKLLHVLSSFWLITGIIGRYVANQKASESKDLQTVRALLPISSVFEQAMVRPGSFAVLGAGLVTAWAQGWPILGFIQGGTSNWVLASLVLFLSLIPLIRFVFLPRGKMFDAALSDAVTKGQVTPELSAAFRDPAVRAAHMYEFGVIAVIVALMVLKPF